ncbi:MAG: response regulator [Cyanothece sp. SIO1E1]|nr:response regulator [Cyanothece sp. SIO1E1]
MPMPDMEPAPSIEALVDEQLQYELQNLFLVDTHSALQQYSQMAQQLRPDIWASQIQGLYRFIHTIKGGAVTVAAEAVLQVATALEDLLSDLRYLNPAPPLVDGQLSQILLEAGELLTSTLEQANTESITPVLNRLHALHNQIRTQYLPAWDANRQMQQEFAEQGFDMVVLDLEIALEQLPAEGTVPTTIVDSARQTLGQLQQIGQDLQLASGWSTLLTQAETLLSETDNHVWQSQWLHLFQILKICIKQGGEPVSPDAISELSQRQPEAQLSETDSLSQATAHLEDLESSDAPEQLDDLEKNAVTADSAMLLDIPQVQAELLDIPQVQADLTSSLPTETVPADNLFATAETFLDNLDAIEQNFAGEVDWAEEELVTVPLDPEVISNPTSAPSPNDLSIAQPLAPQPSASAVQVPVPLERLDRSAQRLIETLLTNRSAQNFHEVLQNQIAQLAALAQESTQYITQLRQIQDDYALLDPAASLSQGPNQERYRQGYTAVNHLLETSLRLSELGAEAEKTAQQAATSLQVLDGNLLKLQDLVEDSRLIPFRNLGFRAKAILRDLTIRYGKPAQLLLKGEQIELDVSTARNLEPALLHLIRNAYDHGLESPAKRVSQGKPEQGTIALTLQRRGDTFLLKLEDDGQGMDADAIQAQATALGLPLTDTQSSDQLLAVICQPGFSSQAQVNEISGRGVGMDVIAAQIAQLEGHLSIETHPGQGTTFSLKFSVPHLLTSCVLLQSGNQIFAIPTEDVRQISLLDYLKVTSTNATGPNRRWAVEDELESTPALDLLDYWWPQTTPHDFTETAVGVYIRTQDTAQGVWILADELVGQSELLIDAFPNPLVPPAGLMGLSLQMDGRLAPVLEVTALVERLWADAIAAPATPDAEDSEQPNFAEPPEVPSIPEQTETVLIVDDAALMRRRIEASLTAYGQVTHTCSDGLEAWNWLQANPHPKLLITDIEMPHMDGFTLIERCRQAGMTLPILVISSRLSEEWFDEARRLGATSYLTKGFSTLELMNRVNGLLNPVTHLNGTNYPQSQFSSEG